MGYVASADLQDLFQDRPAREACRRIAARAAEELEGGARRRSPVAQPSPLESASQFAGRRGRTPGTLKASWRRSGVEETESRGTPRFAGEAYTEDPTAPYVEWPTRPHLIRPRLDRAAASVLETGRPRRMGGDPAARLRFIAGGRVVFAAEVHHPGTQGVHMMRDSLAELDATWEDRIAGPELERWAREQLRLVR